MAVVIPLNNFLGPEGDTVTVDKQLLNTEYCPGSGERQGWRGGKGHDGHTGMIYNRAQGEVRKPKCQRTEG